MNGYCKKVFKTLACLTLALALVVSLVNIAPVKADAAEKEVKAVYTVKQLKTAMKSKAAATIVFRSASVDPITIPSVKKAKNKDLVISAPQMDIVNKSKFKTIAINSVKSYTEAANGNISCLASSD